MVRLNILQPVLESMTVSQIVAGSTPWSWKQSFEDASSELGLVSQVLENQPAWYPLKKDLFNAFQWTPLHDVRVVLIGQDPYHDKIGDLPKARGLSFSVSKDCPIPNSLRNVYRELERTIEGWVKPDHGCLENWALQGVLLLNSCLTVRPSQPGSHGKIWLGFISVIIKSICELHPGCIFLLWGAEAQKMKMLIPSTAIILEAGHPSGMNRSNPFVGCGHFTKVNEILKCKPIDWTL